MGSQLNKMYFPGPPKVSEGKSIFHEISCPKLILAADRTGPRCQTSYFFRGPKSQGRSLHPPVWWVPTRTWQNQGEDTEPGGWRSQHPGPSFPEQIRLSAHHGFRPHALLCSKKSTRFLPKQKATETALFSQQPISPRSTAKLAEGQSVLRDKSSCDISRLILSQLELPLWPWPDSTHSNHIKPLKVPKEIPSRPTGTSTVGNLMDE